MILVGELALWVALLMAAWSAIVSFAGARAGRADLIASGVRGVYAAFVCVVLAMSGVLVALISSDFTFRFVASFTSANLPVGYKLAALWSAPAGTMLFCTLVLSTCAAIMVTTAEPDEPRAPYVAGVFSAIILVFVATVCFAANPYEPVMPPPVEGQGMFPVLQHPAFLLHAPLLYLGSMAASIPFALAMSALFAGRLGTHRTRALRRWTVVSWLLLTIAMMAGMWWAYVEVSDVGHWSLDPVRNLAILPWLAATALPYAMRREQPRASILMATASFLLAVLGVFIARGGIIAMSPVASWSGVAEWLTAFLVAATVTAVYLLLTRRQRLTATVPPNRVGGEKRERYGIYAALAGLLVFTAGLAGSLLNKEADITLGSGETAAITDAFGEQREFTSQGVSRFDLLNRHVVAVALQAAQNGEPAELITSEERQYVDSRGAHTFNPSIEAGIDYSVTQNVSVVLTGVVGDRAQMRIGFDPLVMWVWIGGAMIAVGGAVAMWGTTS